jgi:hypothetical protein
MNLEQATRALDFYMSKDIPAFLWGAPGIGKTEVVHGRAKNRGRAVIDFRLLLRDPVDLRGLPSVDPIAKTTVWVRPSELPFIGNDCPEEGDLFIDELNVAGQSMQAAAFGLVQERRVGENTLKPGWRIVAAGNRMSDKAAAQRVPSALLNRFAHIDVEADVAAWVNWALGANINPALVAFIRWRRGLLHVMPGEKPQGENLAAMPADARAFPTPRAWEHVSELLADAPDDLRPALVGGLVGEGPAGELEGFIRVWRNLPSIADIIANPDKITVPDDPATLYAVAGGLARAADHKNIASIVRFAKRAIGPEFTITMMMDATKRDEGLKETQAYVEYVSANQEAFVRASRS